MNDKKILELFKEGQREKAFSKLYALYPKIEARWPFLGDLQNLEKPMAYVLIESSYFNVLLICNQHHEC